MPRLTNYVGSWEECTLAHEIDDGAGTITSDNWYRPAGTNFWGPGCVNHAHHRLTRIRHFQRAMNNSVRRDERDWWKSVMDYAQVRDNLIKQQLPR